jgi:hypothetical protein
MGIRLDASGIIAGLKWPFTAHTVPFFSHLAQAKHLKKAFAWLKIAHFSHYTDPTHQVYKKRLRGKHSLCFVIP